MSVSELQKLANSADPPEEQSDLGLHCMLNK